MKRRIFSFMMALVMVLSILPVPARAAACEHHVHDEGCNYAAAVQGHECGHVCDEACVEAVTSCVHAHVAECYPEGDTAQEPICGHVCSAESGCVTLVPKCGHVHDESCGYVEAKQAQPCTFVCEICNPPVCDCAVPCAQGAANESCPVCGGDWTKCAKAAPADGPEAGPGEGQEVCTCSVPCAEGAVKDFCPVCHADWQNCAKKAAPANDVPDAVSVTGITVTPEGASVAIGGTIQLTATVEPADAANPTVTWASQNGDIATVDENGLVKGVSVGEALITATAKDGSGISGSLLVTVTDPNAPTGLSFGDLTTVNLTVGGTANNQPTFVPAEPTDKSLTWSSEPASVATVDASGFVTAVAPGTAIITATSVAYPNLSASYQVTVEAAGPHYVADVDGTKYETMDAAFAAVLSGGEITLLDSGSLTIDLNITEALTINMGGHTLTLSNSTLNKICAPLTLNGGGEIIAPSPLQIISGGNLNADITKIHGAIHCDGGTISGGDFQREVNLLRSSEITGGNFSGIVVLGKDSVISRGSFSGEVTSDGTISGGNFSGIVTSAGTVSGGTFACIVTNEDEGSISGGSFSEEVNNTGTISNGTFSGIVKNNGTISNGTFSNEVKNKGTISNGSFFKAVDNDGTIYGGEYSGLVYNFGTIYGGSFNRDPNGFPGSGTLGDVVQNEDGTWTVTPPAVAEVNGTKYLTIEEAFAAATGGSTVTLLRDTALSADLSLDRKYLDTQGHTLDLADHTLKINIYSDDQLSISGSGKIIGNDPSSLNVTGGNYFDTDCVVSCPVNNSGTICGGTFNGTVTNTGDIVGGIFNGTVINRGYIFGGIFNGTVTNEMDISGGIFKDDPATFEGGGSVYGTVTELSDGRYLVTSSVVVAVVNGVSYTNLSDALNVASNGGSMILLQSGSASLQQIDNALNLDMTGKTLTFNGAYTDINADLTVTGGGTIDGYLYVYKTLNGGTTRFTTVVLSGTITSGYFDSVLGTDGTITGGYFMSNPSKFVHDGYTVKELTKGEAYDKGYSYQVVQATNLNTGEVTASATYNGAAQEPTTVSWKAGDQTKTLTLGTDYTVAFGPGDTHTNAGDHPVTLTGVGEYTGTVSGTFTIQPIALTGDMVTVSDPFTGAEPEVTVNVGTTAQTVDRDYTYSVDKAKKQVTVTPVAGGNLTGGSIIKTYTEQVAVAEVTIDETTTLVADIDRAFYLLNAAQQPGTLKLLADVTPSKYVSLNNNLTIDMNGHTLTLNGTDDLGQVGGGVSSTLTLTGGGEIKGKLSVGLGAFLKAGNCTVSADVTTEISSGSLRQGTIESGIFTGSVKNSGTISGGTFTGEVINYYGATISGGFFSMAVTGEEPVSGGYFVHDPIYIADGYALMGCNVTKDGVTYRCKVVPKAEADQAVAEIGGLTYSTLQEAIDVCPVGRTVSLLQTVDNEVITLAKDITIMMNRNYLTTGNGSSISAGTINNTGSPRQLHFNGTISGGTFNVISILESGEITNGTFTDVVTNHGTISGGTFQKTVTNFGLIYGGYFNKINNSYNGSIAQGYGEQRPSGKDGFEFQVVHQDHSYTWTLNKDHANQLDGCCDALYCDREVSVTLVAPTDLFYNGSPKTAKLETSDNWLNTDLLPLITYSEGGNVNAGEVTATITLGGKTAYVEYTILPADSQLPLVVKNGETVRKDFVYGDTVTVLFTPQVATQTKLRTKDPAKDNASLYYGDTLLDEAAKGTDGSFHFEYPTTGKALPIGKDLELTVYYGGSDNLKGVSEKTTIDLAQKEVKVTGVAAVNRPYAPGNKTVKLDLSKADVTDIISGDDVRVAVGTTGTMENDRIGNGKPVAVNGFTLQGNPDHVKYYQLIQPDYVKVDITKITVTITAKPQTITVGQAISQGVTQVTANGFLSGDSLTGITLTATNADKVGTGAITPSKAVTSNDGIYDFKYVDGTLTVTENTFTVTFDSNGGSSVAAQTVEIGGKVVEPKDPTRAKYTFKGWFTDKRCTKAYDFDTPVTADLTLYAKWKRTGTPWWDNPRTGDYIMIAVGVLAVSGAALAGLLVYSKKKKK